MAPHLSKLCATLAKSMIGESQPVSMEVMVNGETVSSSEAVSIGLIVTEAVINALSHRTSGRRSDRHCLRDERH
jgi:two-component sensor histidine kinase